MSNASSPTKFTSDNVYDPNFTQEINSKMRVPKRIKVDGSNEDDMAAMYGQWNGNSAGHGEKVDMQVPDRIVLIGQEQTYGTTAPPREILMENEILPQDPGYIRVHTPPRVITLDQNYRDDYDRRQEQEEEAEFMKAAAVTPVRRPQAPPHPSGRDMVPFNNSLLDTPMPVNGTVRDEITHLRSQMAKQNKRLVKIEYELQERKKRDNILLMVTASYLILKTLIWFAKD
uniref:Transport and Golgi organization protein 11 n=1 Tax=Cacopsylla melanoneura TaxID=428564 RepID=A0A8D8R5P0_9HEMI